MTPKDIIKALPNLKQQELRQLRAVINSLLGQGPVDDCPLVYDALCNAVGQGRPFAAFKRTAAIGPWRANAPAVMGFIEATWPGVQVNLQRGLLNLCLKLLAEALHRQKLPVTYHTMTVNLHRVPEAFDYAFPDYRQTGMAHVVLNALRQS